MFPEFFPSFIFTDLFFYDINHSIMSEKETLSEIRQGAWWAALSYVFFMCFVVVLYARENKFAHFHARQGLVLCILEFLCLLLSRVFILGTFAKFLLLILFFLSFLGIFSALMGKYAKFPGISEIAEKLVV